MDLTILEADKLGLYSEGFGAIGPLPRLAWIWLLGLISMTDTLRREGGNGDLLDFWLLRLSRF